MNLTELKSRLRAHPENIVSLALPDGRLVPAHYHITEVGHAAKKFVDCGGTFRTSEACVLQTWIGREANHRLTAGKLAHILDLAQPVLPAHDLPVEVEYEDGAISQFPLVAISAAGAELRLQLGLKHTDCLARKECGETEGGDGDVDEAACCAGKAASPGCC